MANVMAAVAYLFQWVSGLIVFFISKEDRVARFHGMQAILFSIVFYVCFVIVAIVGVVLSIILGIVVGLLNIPALGILVGLAFPIVMLLFVLVVFVVWLWTIWQAYNDKIYKLPIIGNFAEKFAG